MPSQICKSKKQSRGKRKPFRADCEVGQGSPRIQICESSKILGWAFCNAAATESLISSFKPFNHAAVSPINLLIHRTGCNYFFFLQSVSDQVWINILQSLSTWDFV